MTDKTTKEDKIESKEELLADMMSISQGNIGAATALMNLVEEFGYVRPHFEAMRKLDLTGSRFWLMWKDVCYQKAAMFVAYLEDFLHGNIDMEDFMPLIEELMVRRNPEVAKNIRETYVHPAVNRFLEHNLGVPK